MTNPQARVQELLPSLTGGLLASQGYILGMDIGTYGLRTALIDLHGQTYHCRQADAVSQEPEKLVAQAIEQARSLLAEQNASASHLVRIGVGFGGPVDARKGIVLLSPRMAGWELFPLGERIEQAFDAVTLVDNDANLIALAEATFGAGHARQHLLYVHLSSGVGGGLVLDGRLYHGATTTAGEIGHAVVAPIDPTRPHTHPATLEQLVSVSGLLRRANEAGLHTDLLSDVFGDNPVGRQLVAESVDILAARLSQMVALIDPELIVLGGVVTRNGGQPFINAIQLRMQSYMGGLVHRPLAICASELGFESVAIGALALALESLSE